MLDKSASFEEWHSWLVVEDDEGMWLYFLNLERARFYIRLFYAAAFSTHHRDTIMVMFFFSS